MAAMILKKANQCPQPTKRDTRSPYVFPLSTMCFFYLWVKWGNLALQRRH
ncbi:Uncharacterised protein [Vibrio cholerae]|nr:Uncharacterised protein [Vibrio cholerae]CSI49596.1 Uncharacterised protein [Vibrio cholerae]